MESVLLMAVVYLLAATVCVPLAVRLGLGSVLGYLVAGVLIGPLTGLVGSETTELQHFAEFGVVMMLFLIGLELKPRALWQMRVRLLGLGLGQVVLTAALLIGLALAAGLESGAVDRGRFRLRALLDRDRDADAEREEADGPRRAAAPPSPSCSLRTSR